MVALAMTEVKHILYAIAYIALGYMVKYYFPLRSSASHNTSSNTTSENNLARL
jgi:hypothetical protein